MPDITPEAVQLARLLWDYHHLHHTLKPADCIMALGSHDLRVAERAAQLYLDGYAPVLAVSGGLGRLTEGVWTEPEADQFARIALQMGVPQSALIVENRSTNTGENIRFTRDRLQERGLAVSSVLLVQKPYMERRTWATFRAQWPGPEAQVTSPQISFDDYPTHEIPLERVLHIMVGDLQRIRTYPALGFQVEQEIPERVWAAWERLVEMGFDGQLV